ncbi:MULTISPECIES: ribonuclease toxin immunity protein CdiI [Paenibacillus]|jgi:hypothetical protein|uniref:ribonuclease toxin immunity protein CdiI n=1 Tax=Paenibacillus TaxID=44249 RepID=UPI0006763138|nr:MULTISPECIES: ribonuclease toxin immunity protein CdiI [Paenibacillus]APB74858.1 hypothetical protein PPYC2_07625 [Paenibacillus polymyxa]MCP3743930.1 ribonuclease toxin immunity protein CdiI [Paenibacillus sp. A3M_27_13]ODB59302.1 hypothetical protein A7309_20885 [Paenibacillus polymyxa]OMF74642.1 hypothetical protein BK145_22950 [Paenibacillus peoriae]SFR23329.1 hypothetical protein SAMN04488603_107147 [Paenibacillus sp. cl130]
MKNILNSEDLISIEHLPLEGLVNFCYLSNSFKDAMKYLSREVGFGTDFGGFTFWSDLDESDKSLYHEEFKGIEIEYGDDSIIIAYENLYYYFKLAAKRYIEKNPQDEQEIEKYLKEMRSNLNVEQEN